MERVLVIGSGGREHALAWKLSQSKFVDQVFCAPGNGGTFNNIDCSMDDFEGIVGFVKERKIDLTVIGPEAPLMDGIVDYFNKKRLKAFGPTKRAAILEGSKAFAREFMRKYDIPAPNFEVASDIHHAKSLCERYLKDYGGVVVKADGLAQGKGVFVCKSPEDAVDAVNKIMVAKEFGSSGEKVVIEELLEGSEASILALCDGKNAKPLMPSQDYKRAYDGNKGPNTGGMGAIAPTPVVDGMQQRIMDDIILPTLRGMASEGREYKGILYAGLMITESGPKVLEYNVRFGDPETQVALPLLETDLYKALNGCIEGNLDEIKVQNSRKTACCVVLASQGYPGKYEKGFNIAGLGKLKEHPDLVAFHAGTKRQGSNVLTNGGRVMGMTGIDDEPKRAVSLAYSGAGMVDFDNKYYRKDIGD